MDGEDGSTLALRYLIERTRAWRAHAAAASVRLADQPRLVEQLEAAREVVDRLIEMSEQLLVEVEVRSLLP